MTVDYSKDLFDDKGRPIIIATRTGRGATYVLAAANSSAKNKAQADFTLTAESLTDNTKAAADVAVINALITAMTLGGEIRCLSGSYYVSTPVLYTDAITFSGENYDTTKFYLCTGANCNMFERTGALSTENFFVIFRDLYMHGNKDNNSSGTGIWSADYSHDMVIERCFIDSFKSYNIYLKNVWNVTIDKCLLEHAASSGYALYIDGGNDLRITNNKFLYNYKGVYLKAGDGRIISNYFFHLSSESHSYEIQMYTATQNMIIGNDFRSDNSTERTYAVIMEDACKDNIIIGNYFYGYSKTQKAIYEGSSVSSASESNIITGNVFDGFTTPPVYQNPHYSHANRCVRDNKGYLAPGETRTLSYSIKGEDAAYTDLTQNAIASIDNPLGQDVIVTDVKLVIGAGATSTTPDIQIGVGSSATTDYANLINDAPGETPGNYWSLSGGMGGGAEGVQTSPLTWASESGDRYLNVSIKDAAATGMEATLIITVVGK